MSVPPLPESQNRNLVARPLTVADAPAFAALCACDPARFLLPRLNIERHGFDSPGLRVWGAFPADASPAMHGVLMRFTNTLVAADTNGDCGPAFAQIADNESGLAGVRGAAETVQSIAAALRAYVSTDQEESIFMCLLRPPSCAPERLTKARRATCEDLNKLAYLYANAGNMYRSRAGVEAKLTSERVFVVEEPATFRRPDRIVSCALINVEGREAGVIGGVFTLPEARGKGYASACTAALALDLQHDGKMPCLFYENPVAGRVYRNLGFEAAGRWTVLYLASRRRFT
jgi:uncharacterized protein